MKIKNLNIVQETIFFNFFSSICFISVIYLLCKCFYGLQQERQTSLCIEKLGDLHRIYQHLVTFPCNYKIGGKRKKNGAGGVLDFLCIKCM